MDGNRRGQWKHKGGNWMGSCPAWFKKDRARRERHRNNQLVRQGKDPRDRKKDDLYDWW